MGIYDKNNIEFEIRDIGGLDVYYKRNIGDNLWSFSSKEEFEQNTDIMNKGYTESDIERGAKIELEEHKKTLMKYVKEGVGLMDVARQIAIEHLKENPNSYPVEDIVSMNVPLFIRMLELAREDIKTDADLHKIVEKVIIASKEKGLLTMQDYNSFIVDMPNEEKFADGGLIAPNGKPSNLTPEQYKLVRSEEFKKWFGDWENDPKNASKVVDSNGEPLVVYHGTKSESINIFDERVDSGTHFGTKKSAIERREQTDYDHTGKYNLIPVFLNIKNPLIINEDMNWESESYGDFQPEEIDRSFIDWAISNGYDITYRGDGIVVDERLLPQGYYVKSHKSRPFVVYNDFDRVVAGGDTKQQAISSALSMLGKPIPEQNGVKTLKEFLNDYGFGGIFYKNEVEDAGNFSYLVIESNKIKLADGSNTTFDENNPDIRFADGGEVEDLISQGVIELKIFKTESEHAKKYGLDSVNPLFIQSLNVNENQRLKGVGKKVLQYIDDYAIKNGHDVVFGHITQKATMTKDNRTGYFTEFTDIDFIKHWLFRNGYNVNRENNDFYKVIASDSNDINNEHNSDVSFEDGGKIQLNSNKGKVNLKLSSYEDVTELVPVSELLKFREFNRNERPKYSLEDSKDNISKLEKALVENGVEEPLIIEYSLEDNSVLLIEGNHRLNVAENLGFDYLPARVVLRRREFTPLQKTKAFKVKGFTPDRYGYVPSDLKPSQVGIGGTTKAFEEGGIVEGQLHSECNEETGCGEKYDVGGVGHIIEVERDEAVIVSKAFQDNNQYEIKGNPSEIASALNVLGDGKNFDSGAEIKTEDGKKVEVAEIKKEAKNTDVETIDPNSIIINRRSMYDKKEYVAKGTPKQIASQINNLNDNGVKIVDGGSIKKA